MNICVTLDYELFLNDRTGSVNNCLIRPMAEFVSLCNQKGIRATIFVDAAYLYMLNKLKGAMPYLEKDYDMISYNIRELHSQGYDMELHLHPQWFFSEFLNGVWLLDWDHYRLADVEPDQAMRYFEDSKNLLDEIINKKTTIFRAGGYSLPGFDYEKAFKKTGIVADSSVLPGVFEITNTHKFDYRKAPSIPYRFTKDVEIPHANGEFIELPISFANRVFISDYYTVKKHNMQNNSNVNWGDGGDNPKSGVINKVKRKLSSFSLYKKPKATIDYQSFFFLKDAYEASKERGYLTIIGHPKNFSRASLDYFDAFVEDCLNNGDQFMTAEEYCKTIKYE